MPHLTDVEYKAVATRLSRLNQQSTKSKGECPTKEGFGVDFGAYGGVCHRYGSGHGGIYFADKHVLSLHIRRKIESELPEESINRLELNH